MKNVGSGAAAGILPVSGAFAVCADEAAVRPPQGSALLLELAPKGVQIYACDAKDNGFESTFKAPAADLFDRQGRQIGTHFGSPTWKINDGSGVVGESHEGARTLSAAAYIRRTETRGGVAPRTGCDARHLSEQARSHYSATYQFYDAPNRN
jgi:hypothetical protein